MMLRLLQAKNLQKAKSPVADSPWQTDTYVHPITQLPE
jgi:hypothetical protein